MELRVDLTYPSTPHITLSILVLFALTLLLSTANRTGCDTISTYMHCHLISTIHPPISTKALTNLFVFLFLTEATPDNPGTAEQQQAERNQSLCSAAQEQFG